MFIPTIFGFVLATLTLGLGIGIGFKLLRLGYKTRRQLKEIKSNNEAQESYGAAKQQIESRHRLSNPKGTRRTTSIHGITKCGLIRHTDGGYTKAYKVKMHNTIYADHALVDRIRNAVAIMLAAVKLPGVIIQFRHYVKPDSGDILLRHIKNMAPVSASYRPARSLHTVGLANLEDKARAKSFQRSDLTLWIRIPFRHSNDPSRSRIVALAAFFPAVFKEFRRKGLLKWSLAVATAWSNTNRDRICARAVEDEEEALEEARQVFAQIEELSRHLHLTPLTRNEIWKAVYLDHRRNEHNAPNLSDVEGFDLRQHLCAEDIRGDGEFILHGRQPGAIVSLFSPPAPVITADLMRFITVNPNTIYEHEDIVEFVTLDQKKAKSELKGLWDSLSRAHTATSKKSPDPEGDDPDGYTAADEIKKLRKEIAGSRQTLISARVYTRVFSEPARDREELRRSLNNLDSYCRQTISAYGFMAGASPGREAPEGLRALWHNSQIGELDPRVTGREVKEIAASLARLIPLETRRAGSATPHTVVVTPSGHLTGFDLYDKNEISAALGAIIGGPGSGKSVLLMLIIYNLLAYIAKIRVKVVEYGGSCEPLVRAFGGRHVIFDPKVNRTINVWAYKDIEHRIPPSERQIKYVLWDALQLAEIKPGDPEYKYAKVVLNLLIRQVYRQEIARNRPGRPRHEPIHSNLVDELASHSFDDPELDKIRALLHTSLKAYVGHPFIDAPTHKDFLIDSPLDVFELKSLENFDDQVRNSLALRVAALVIESEGYRDIDGTRTKMFIAFDEMWKFIKKYPVITEIIEEYARTGRKEGVFTMLATQGFEDICGSETAPNPIGHALMACVGVKFIGLQQSKYEQMANTWDFTEETIQAIDSIRNVIGKHSQFVGIWGSGKYQLAEMLQIELNSLELWTMTTNDDERNARQRIQYLKPHWHPTQVHLWLAEHYPRGLVAVGLKAIDESLLERQSNLGLAA
jgi:hypothetical protein